MNKAIIIAGALLSTVAHADPSFELLDRGDAVEIIAHGMKATRTAIAPIRSRLEVPVGNIAAASRLFPRGDGTIVQVDLDGAPTARVVSVKLKYEHPEVVQFARFAQAVQVGDDLHILVPRKLPVDGQPARLPEPTLPVAATPAKPVVAAAVASVIGPMQPPKAPEVPKVDAPKVSEKPAAVAKTETVKSADTSPATKSEPAKAEPAAKPDTAPKAQAAKPMEEQSSPFSMVIAGGLVLCGGALWVAKKRKKALQGNQPAIEVIAQKSLGGKARIVWLNAAGRDLVVAVTPQQVRMLHASAMQKPAREPSIGARRQPQRTQRVVADNILDEEPMFAQGSVATVAPTRPSNPKVSAQISGLLKLREEVPSLPSRGRLGTPPHGQPAALPLADDIATDDYEADEMWAKEIRAATATIGLSGGRK